MLNFCDLTRTGIFIVVWTCVTNLHSISLGVRLFWIRVIRVDLMGSVVMGVMKHRGVWVYRVQKHWEV